MGVGRRPLEGRYNEGNLLRNGNPVKRCDLAHVRLLQEQKDHRDHRQKMQQDDQSDAVPQPQRTQFQHRVTAGANR